VVKRYRDVTEKYRSFRLAPESLYGSRILQTIFNKFTKKGNKAKARRHVMKALIAFRFHLRRPRMYNALLYILRELRVQFILVPTRQGRNIIEVPTPIRRNQRDIINLQVFYNAVKKRDERAFDERLHQELLAISLYQDQSTTLRQRTQIIHRVYEERV
jgi:ribosomal protein S7